MDPNWNNTTYHPARLAVVKASMDKFGFPITSINPIAYDPTCPYPYNNFLFLVTLSAKMCNPQWTGLYAGSTPWSQPTDKVVFRFSNRHPDTGMNVDSRVANEIAAMQIARAALRGVVQVPEVWAWKGVPGYWGEHPSTAMQYIDGEPLDEVYATLSKAEKIAVVKQIAAIVAAMQKAEVPATVRGFGGLGFEGEESGSAVVGGPMAVYKAGPFASYADMVKGMMRCKLEEADKSDILRGWKRIRSRLNTLVETGVDALLKDVDTSKRCLAHGDFTMNNMLYSKATGKITGVVDFDWSSVSHPATDLLTSYPNYARLPNRYSSNDEQLALRMALLDGFPESLPASSDLVDWETAKLWDEQMAAAGNVRAASMKKKEFDVLSWLYEVLELLCPDMLTKPTILRMRANQRDKMEKEKVEAEALIEKALEDWENGKIGG